MFVVSSETINQSTNRKGKQHEIIYGIGKNVNYYEHHRIELIGTDAGKAYILINDTEHELKMYFRNERTWNDHMGNTPCGYYVNLPFPDGTKKRAYL